MSIGIARRALNIMKKYANERISFGKKLLHFGQIQRYIANSYSELLACRHYLYNIAKDIHLSMNKNRLDSDGVKLVCSRMAKKVADRAIQVLGANGYVSEYIVERLFRDSKLLEIGGGTIEAHQKNIVSDLISNV
jgi:isovaleryl-CoA dehydrogenase